MEKEKVTVTICPQCQESEFKLLDTHVLREGGYIYQIQYQDCTGHTFTDWCHGLVKEQNPKTFGGDYNAKCSFCWLGYPHTAAYHNDAIKEEN